MVTGSVKRSGVNSEVAQLSNERVGSDLERQSSRTAASSHEMSQLPLPRVSGTTPLMPVRLGGDGI